MSAVPGLTSAQAQSGNLANITATVAALPGVTLGARVGAATQVTCDDRDSSDTGPVTAGVDYWIEGTDPARTDDYLDQFVRHWTAQGWSVTVDQRPGRALVGVRNHDGYGLSMTSTVGTPTPHLSISAQSPCFDPARSS